MKHLHIPAMSGFAFKYTAPSFALRIRNKLLYPNLVVDPSTTSLVVEGFPRAANTYVYEVAKCLCMEAGLTKIIAHHLHTHDQIESSARYSIPLALVVRTPSDSIASLCTRRDIDVNTALKAYIKYHVRALEYLKTADSANFIILDFQRVTADNQMSWVADLERLLAIKSVYNYEDICQKAKKRIYKRNESLANRDLMSNLPNSSRKDLLAKAKKLAISSPEYHKAFRSFEAILKTFIR